MTQADAIGLMPGVFFCWPMASAIPASVSGTALTLPVPIGGNGTSWWHAAALTNRMLP